VHGWKARPADVGRARARQLSTAFGRELRLARLNAGLTEAAVARLAGTTQQRVSKVELGSLRATLDLRCRLAAACGCELGWRLYPTSTIGLRDSGQLGLAEVILAAVHPSWRVELERPVAAGDPRAADLLLGNATGSIQIEIERSLVDLQAQLRQARVKRDVLSQDLGHPVCLVIAVPATSVARERVATHAAAVRTALPVAPRRVWAALRQGMVPDGDGLIYVRRQSLR
jgi:transcriptional regulator with XRE-family HTH domain